VANYLFWFQWFHVTINQTFRFSATYHQRKCWDGHLAKMAKLASLSYSEMLSAIVRAAEERLSIQTPDGQKIEQAPDLLKKNDKK